MREILFRGKVAEDNDYYGYKKGNWIYGNYSYDIMQKVLSIEDTSKEDIALIEVEENTVGQYTGIKDVNGTKIFEGDIVEITCKFKGKVEFENCGVVKYKDSGFIVDIFTDEEAFDFCLLKSICNNERENTCIVIGNIYDDPELLGGCKND